jgi:hypothetical protein
LNDQAVENGGSNPGRTANQARENLWAILAWAWEQEFLAKLPPFPKPKPQRDVAGRHCLTKPDLNSLYFATYQLPQLRGWKRPFTVGHCGERHWSCSSIMRSIPGLYLSPRASMSRSCGVMTHNEAASKHPNVTVLTARVALLQTLFNGRTELVSRIDWPG